MLPYPNFLAHRRSTPAAAILALISLIIGCQQSQPTPPSSIPAEPSRSSLPEHAPSQDQPLRHNRRDRRSQTAHPDRDTDPHFDFYLLNLSWSPEFCWKRPQAPECAQHRAFTLHGLWPQRFDGSYPEHCSDAAGPANPQQFRNLYPDAGLLQHEWQTHGTCSGLDPQTFFERAQQAEDHVRIPAQLTDLDHQISLTPEAILTLFAQSNADIPRESLTLSCGNNFLTAVELCLDKQLHPIACGPIRSCRANSVRIPPVYSERAGQIR